MPLTNQLVPLKRWQGKHRRRILATLVGRVPGALVGAVTGPVHDRLVAGVDEEHEQLRADQVPRSRPARYPWPIRRIPGGELHDAQTTQHGEKLDRRQNSPIICGATSPVRYGSAARPCVACSCAAGPPSNAPRPHQDRTKTWKEATDSFFGAKLDRMEYAINERSDRTFAFDEFGPGVFVPQPVRAGSPRAGPAGFRRPVTAPTESPTSPAATRSATAPSGVSTGAARASPRPGRRSRTSVRHGRTALRSSSSCASRRRTRPGRTRSRHTSGRCGSSPWPAPTTPTTPSRPGRCTATCAGATRTPATPTS